MPAPLPVPMMNIINGGAHADNPIDIQEFMILPVAAPSVAEAIRMGSEVFHALKKALKDAGHNTNVGDEGGFAPNLKSADARARTSSCRRSRRPVTSRARTSPSRLDPASSEFYQGRQVRAGRREEGISIAKGMVKYYAKLVASYPIVSIEDGMAEDDWEGWKLHRPRRWATKIQLVGDDLFVTNPSACWPWASSRASPMSILIKVNQIGTLSETLEAVEMAHKAGYTRRHLAPLGRDRGHDHRRSGGGHQLRPDQDRLDVALRPHRQIQPADPHRGRAGIGRALCRRQRGATQGVIALLHKLDLRNWYSVCWLCRCLPNIGG